MKRYRRPHPPMTNIPRYCGRVKILITYVSVFRGKSSHYDCDVFVGNRKVHSTSIESASVLPNVASSPESYDVVARLAVLSAFLKKEISLEDCEWSDKMPRIRRVRPR